MAERFDIAIVGGGLSAASCAWALACSELPLSVALLAPDPPPALPAVDFNAPSIALSHRSVRSYEQLNIWGTLAADVAAIERVHVSRQGAFGAVTMDAHSEGWASLGQVVESQRLQFSLWQRLADSSVALLDSVRVEECRVQRTGIELSLTESESSSRRLCAGLVIAADGAQSPLAAQLGMARRHRDYGHSALLCNVIISGLKFGTAWERFTATGSVALLPLSPPDDGAQRMLLVAVVPTAHCEELAALDDSDLGLWLNRVMGARGLCLRRVGSRRHRPLIERISAEQWRPGILLIGDAAHTLHPVAAQGFNLVLRDIMAWVQQLGQAVAVGETPGSAAVLSRYEKSRYADQRWVRSLSAGLHYWLIDQRLPAPLLGAGLAALELTAPLKSRFLRRASGF